jgi:hypothetical protein
MSDINSSDLKQVESARGLGKMLGYLRLSGPAWVQSAITLGGGTLAGALYLGIIGGYSMLWVQPLAVALGVVILAAIAYVTLSIERSPFEAIRSEINPALAWLWLIASVVACGVWIIPQFALSYAVLSQNLLPNAIPNPGLSLTKFAVTAVVFVVIGGVTLRLGRDSQGLRVYESVLKILIALVVLAFMVVVVRLATGDSGLPWAKIFAGFIPDFSQFFRPIADYEAVLSQIANDSAREYWRDKLIDAQRLRIIGAASAAVGINMTFVLPFTLLRQNWGRAHRRFAIVDLAVGMIIPFVIATACLVVVSASLYHAEPFEGLLVDNGASAQIDDASPGAGAYKGLIAARDGDQRLGAVEIVPAERQIAAMLVNRDAAQLARSLDQLTNNPMVANSVFGFGVLAMGLSTISALMLISSFAFQAAFPNLGKEKAHRLGVGLGATGLLWPFVWQGDAQVFLAVSASALNYVMLPIAAIAFWIIMNSKRVLGDALPTGKARWIWNILLGTSTLVIGSGALYTAASKKLTIAGTVLPIGIIVMILMALLIVVFQRWRPGK